MSSSDSSFSVAEFRQRMRSWQCGQCAKKLTLLLLLSGGLLGGASSGSSTTSGGGGGTATGADVQEELLDVLALEGLGEDGGPDGLDLGDLGGGDEGLELVGL